MTSTKIEFAFNRIARISDLSDLSEMLFPGNRNQQHAFLVIMISLKWQADVLVPNLAERVQDHGVSRRTFERVRAKMRRMGLIDRVSRFNAKHGYREGWILSTRFERGLQRLADRFVTLKDAARGSKDKEMLLVDLAEARRNCRKTSLGLADARSNDSM